MRRDLYLCTTGSVVCEGDDVAKVDELWRGGDGDDLAGRGAVSRVLRPTHHHQVQHVRRVYQLPGTHK